MIPRPYESCLICGNELVRCPACQAAIAERLRHPPPTLGPAALVESIATPRACPTCGAATGLLADASQRDIVREACQACGWSRDVDRLPDGTVRVHGARP